MFQLRQLAGAELEHVGHEAHRRPGRVDPGPAGDVLLEDVVLDRPGDLGALDALALGGGHVQGDQGGRRRVDRHRGRDLAERDPVDEGLHVGQARDRDADPAHLALRLRGVRVVAHLGRQVEGDREAGLALLQEVAEALVRLDGGREAGVLAHRPEAASVHRRLDAPGERGLAGTAEVALLVDARGVGRACTGPPPRCPRTSRSAPAVRARPRPPSGASYRANDRGRGRPDASRASPRHPHSTTSRRSPSSIVWPGPTATPLIVPARGALSSFCIFIASTTSTR